MERRKFLRTCARAVRRRVGSRRCRRGRDAPPRLYARTRLVDIHGAPIRRAALVAETNYVFHYPFAATPCFLLKLRAAGRRRRRRCGARTARRTRGRAASGRERNVVAFSAICAHKLAYPTREVSFIRYQRERSATSDAQVIHCCADHSVYDPAAGRARRRGAGAAAARRDPARATTRRPTSSRRSARWAPSSSTPSSRSTSSSWRLEYGQARRRSAVGGHDRRARARRNTASRRSSADVARGCRDRRRRPAQSLRPVEAVSGISFAVRARHDDGAARRQRRRQDDDAVDAARACSRRRRARSRCWARRCRRIAIACCRG